LVNSAPDYQLKLQAQAEEEHPEPDMEKVRRLTNGYCLNLSNMLNLFNTAAYSS
jgi:hypothetical protein